MSEFLFRADIEGECRRLERERLSIRRADRHRSAWLAMRRVRRNQPVRPLVHWMGRWCVRIGERLCRWAAVEANEYGASASGE